MTYYCVVLCPRSFSCPFLSICRQWDCFSLLFILFAFISGNEVSWVLILGEYFSVSLLKAKEVKEFYFDPCGFFSHPLLTDLEETRLFLLII